MNLDDIKPIEPSDDGFKESSDAIKQHIFQSLGVPKHLIEPEVHKCYSQSMSVAQAITEKWLADQKRKTADMIAQMNKAHCIRCFHPTPHRSAMFGFRGLCFDCAMALS